MDNTNPNSSVENTTTKNQSTEPSSSPIKTEGINTKDIDTDSIMSFIKEIFSKSIKTFQDSKTMTPLLLAGLVSWIIVLIPMLGFFSLSLITLLLTASAIASIIFSFSVANIALKSAKGEVAKMEDATKPLSRIVDYIITYIQILIQFIIRLFQPPFIIPGFKYLIGSALFLMENLDNDTPNDKAVKKSLELTKGNVLNIFCLGIAIALLSIVLGLIPFAIGTIFTTPFGALCLAHVYLKLKK